MGACLGSCVSKEAQPATRTASYTSCLCCRATDEQDAELVSNTSARSTRANGFIYRILRHKSNKKKYPKFLQTFREHQSPDYAKLYNQTTDQNVNNADIQLQNLDVFKLLNGGSGSGSSSGHLARESELLQYTMNANVSSRASSSLDLEWEHEYSQLRQYQLQQQQQQLLKHDASESKAPHVHVNNYQAYSSCDQLNTPATACSMTSLNTTAAIEAPTSHRSALNATASSSHAALLAGLASAQRSGRHRMSTRHGSFTRNYSCGGSSQNSWSHISTPESLEWDIDAEQEQQRRLRLEDDSLDDETLKLLHQIEQLKNHVLQETGVGLSATQEDVAGIEFNATHFGSGSEQLSANIS